MVNGNFEAGNFDCQESSFLINPILDNWRNVSLLPIFHRRNCQAIGNPDNPPLPNSGRGHLGIQGNAWVTGFVDGSVALGELSTPLQAGQLYYLEFYGKSTGLRQDENFQSKLCPFNPPNDVTFYLGGPDDTFTAEKVFDDSTLFLESTTVITSFYPLVFSEPILIKPSQDNWSIQRTCFRAQGGETQIAIGGPIRPFANASPCTVLPREEFNKFEGQRLHQIFSYEVDDLVLTALLNELQGAITVCEEQRELIDLTTYLPTNLSIFEEATFQWPDGSTDAQRVVTRSGQYEIMVVLPCETMIPLQLEVTVNECPNTVYFPNAFSPNNDGINDEFRPLFSEFYEVAAYTLEVYDRWGGKVFQSNSTNRVWNGRINNQLAPNGVYFWRCRYELVGFEGTEQLNGTVSLLK
ncbi:MAG: gliding motility-associated C-terminal domain-containing protein [Bacteroidota bacterium]